MARAFDPATTIMEFPTEATARYTMERTSGIYIMRAANRSLFGASGHATYVNNSVRSDHYINAKGGVARISLWSFSPN